MEFFVLAILIVIVGALFWLGWFLAPFIFVALIVIALVRYHRQIPRVLRAFWREWMRRK